MKILSVIDNPATTEPITTGIAVVGRLYLAIDECDYVYTSHTHFSYD